MKRAVLLVLATLCALAAVLFAAAFHGRYWRWRGCFNELGRCYDPDSGEVFLEQAGIVWGAFAAVSLLLCLFFVWRLLRRR